MIARAFYSPTSARICSTVREETDERRTLHDDQYADIACRVRFLRESRARCHPNNECCAAAQSRFSEGNRLFIRGQCVNPGGIAAHALSVRSAIDTYHRPTRQEGECRRQAHHQAQGDRYVNIHRGSTRKPALAKPVRGLPRPPVLGVPVCRPRGCWERTRNQPATVAGYKWLGATQL